jgi:hypothetical protein
MRAIGAIFGTESRDPTADEIHTHLFDYYDHWDEVDGRIAAHHSTLSLAAEVFAKDLVNMATYTHEILGWLNPEKMPNPHGVLAVSGMTEAFLISARCACDSLGIALVYVLPRKTGQAPSSSLRKLLQWAEKNDHRIRDECRGVLGIDFDWFWRLRSFRDVIVHDGTTPNIYSDRKQFNLWMYSPTKGWVTREPLLPFLALSLSKLMAFADSVGNTVESVVALPTDRRQTRMLHGIRIQSLAELCRRAPDYAEPSP